MTERKHYVQGDAVEVDKDDLPTAVRPEGGDGRPRQPEIHISGNVPPEMARKLRERLGQ